MHLLNTTTKQLESFYSENAPKYAILSHMWGKDEDEVTFSHIVGSDDTRREGERRKGYAKIEGACQRAIEDGLKYIWIDTCCINKESSAELSEAINSMYKWYEKAKVCYVYLEDVQSSRHGQNNPFEDVQMNRDNDDGPFKIVPFKDSRWFTRGWTLQELIAPRHIIFYSKDWIDIGTKASLQDIISSTTHIRVEMLIAYDPKKASIAERMSWAAYRKTTRKEDIAYCLMGLFSVNMPLLYGEGDKAFRRLQEEIMNVSDDHSLFAWKARFASFEDQYDSGSVESDGTDEETRGMLAHCPWNFRHGMHIVPSNDGAYSPYSMTNQGLQIQLPLEPIDLKHDKINIDSGSSENMFKSTLKCTIRHKKTTRWVVIYLKMIRKGYYQRIFPHWLDETEVNPNENELMSLLVPQVVTSVDSDFQTPELSVKILPTESGFIVDGHSLLEGYEEPRVQSYSNYKPKVAVFDGLEGSCFALVVGVHNDLPWLDVIEVHEEWRNPQKRNELKDEIKKDYKEGGYKRNVVLQNLDRLFMKISENWLMAVSVKKVIRHEDWIPSYCVTVDIQPRWYNPPLTSTASANNFGDFSSWSYKDSYKHPAFTKEHSDLIVVFNPKAKVADVNLIHNINSWHPSNFEHLPAYCFRQSLVRFSPNGKYLASVYRDIPLRIFETNTGAEICLLPNEIRTLIKHICFSPDSKFLAVSRFTDGFINTQIELWDIEKRHICKVHHLHHMIDRTQALCFSPDGRLIVMIYQSSDETIRIWDVIAEKSEILTVGRDLTFRQFSCDGRLVAIQNDGNIVQIWDVVNKQSVREFKARLYDIELSFVIFTPDEKGLLVAGGDGLEYWDVDELVSAQVKDVEESNSAKSVNGPMVSGVLDQGETSPRTISEDCVCSMPAVSHDARWVIFGSDDGSVQFCNLKDATTQFVLHWPWADYDRMTLVDMSPVGNIFATGSQDGTVRIWSYDIASEE